MAVKKKHAVSNELNELASSQYAPFSNKTALSSFWGGGRRQKNESIVVSARGRRTPQAPTLRISGCANARKYDYKSSSLYSQSREGPSSGTVVLRGAHHNESWVVVAVCRLRSVRRAIAALHPEQAHDATPVAKTAHLKLSQCANGPGRKRKRETCNLLG